MRRMQRFVSWSNDRPEFAVSDNIEDLGDQMSRMRVAYERSLRHAGASKYTFSKLLQLAVTGIAAVQQCPAETFRLEWVLPVRNFVAFNSSHGRVGIGGCSTLRHAPL